MKFLDYITNIETLADIKNEGEGDVFFRFNVSGFGLSGDGEATIEFPYIQMNGDGGQETYGWPTLPIFEIISQNAINGYCEFPLLQTEGELGEPTIGNIQLPIFEVDAWGRSGNDGEFQFYIEVTGEGNANREYELCESTDY
jgi:hypothetical protein